MAFVLTSEQESIRETARRFSRERAPVSQLRGLRDTRDAVGFSRETWKELADLGLAGLALPAEHGGAGLGFAELGLVLEELGRTLAATPLVATVLLGAGAVVLGGSAAQKEELLPGVATGELLLALAHEEGTRHARHALGTTATATADGFRITGRKRFVLDGQAAGTVVVAARTGAIGEARPGDAASEGLTLFLVPASAPGVSLVRTWLIDSRGAADVGFEDVLVPRSAVLGELGGGGGLLDAVLDRATIGLCAEMLGSLTEVFERTVAYLKVRRQFGVAIGSFQALKHRAAHLFCEIELTRSVVMDALRAVDERRPDVPLLASAAKARASDTFLLAAAEAIQMHGGVGVTDELEIGFFLKRARTTEMTLGDAAFHRDRFAKLSGY